MYQKSPGEILYYLKTFKLITIFLKINSLKFRVMNTFKLRYEYTEKNINRSKRSFTSGPANALVQDLPRCNLINRDVNDFKYKIKLSNKKKV